MVASAEPFHWTMAADRKLVPFTVSVNAAEPAGAVTWLRLVIVGPLTAKVVASDELASGFNTAMLALPALAIRLAGTVAVNCVTLTNVVASEVPFH